MKKIFVILTAALMTTVFVACGNKTAGVTDEVDSTAVDSVIVETVIDTLTVDSAFCAE